MRVGVVFPQTEIGADPGGIRAFAEAAEQLGYGHLVAYDHVLGADPSVHHGWNGPYDLRHTFHEPLVLFGWLAGFSGLGLATGILIGPQRQTALVAKQAAEVDVLSGGGRRLDEQIVVLRRLWVEPSVTFTGEFHTLTGAGIAPPPVQRPIPIWL